MGTENEIMDQESSNGTFQVDADAHEKAKLDENYKEGDLSETPEIDPEAILETPDDKDADADTDADEEGEEETPDEEEEGEEEESSEVEQQFDAWSLEFHENGNLSDESRQAAIDSIFADNVPDEIKRQLVESYEGGLNQVRVANTKAAFDIAGGEEGYSQMVKWAETALETSEIDAFDNAVTSDDTSQRDTAIKGLYARMQQAVGSDPNFEPDLAHEGQPGGGEPLISSRRELVKLQRTEEYKKDPSYRAKVARMLEQSMASGKYLS